jgi:hypothetical protein
MKDWITFEKLTEDIFNKLSSNSEFERIDRNVKLNGKDGPRQIDILIRTEVCKIQILTIIECKDHNRKISVGAIDAFHSKLQDVNANKGIFITRLGYSSTAIKKAERLGITLCTAHEVLNEKWNIDFDLPVLIEEHKPLGLDIEYKLYLDEVKEYHSPQSLTINGKVIPQYVDKLWREGNLEYSGEPGSQLLSMTFLKPPYWIEFPGTNEPKQELLDLKILLELSVRCYIVKLSEIEGTQVLKNYSDKKASIFLEIESIAELIKPNKEVNIIIRKSFMGIHLIRRVTPNLLPSPQVSWKNIN